MNKKGNILVIVIFIMFVSSLAGLLITKYVKSMISYSGEVYKYYKAYYIAYGGIEIELTKIKNHGFGWEDSISKSSQTVKNNFKDCFGTDCYFESSVKSLSKIINSNVKSYEDNSCNIGKSITLKNGQGIIVPLFKDINNGEGRLSGINYNNITNGDFASINISFYQGQNEKIGIGVVDEALSSKSQDILINSDPQVINLNTPSFNGIYNENNRSYFILINIENSYSNIRFCLNSVSQALPSSNIIINSNGKFFDRVVSLEAIKQNKLPEYLIYNIIGN